MAFAGLLHQSITIKPASTLDEYGRPTFGAGVTLNCRFEKMNKVKLLPNGQSIVINARVFVPGDTTVSVDDHIEFGSDIYKVINVSVLVDGAGTTRHKELDLQSWVI